MFMLSKTFARLTEAYRVALQSKDQVVIHLQEQVDHEREIGNELRDQVAMLTEQLVALNNPGAYAAYKRAAANEAAMGRMTAAPTAGVPGMPTMVPLSAAMQAAGLRRPQPRSQPPMTPEREASLRQPRETRRTVRGPELTEDEIVEATKVLKQAEDEAFEQISGSVVSRS